MSDRARRGLGCLVLLLLSLAVYAPSLSAGFIWDDDTHLLTNPVFEPGGLVGVWASPPEVINYWPLTYTTYWIEHRLWGFEPAGYHVVNTLLHGFCGMLVWGVLRRLRIPLAWLVAVLFVVHPVNVESVAWVAQRKTLLSGLFFGLSLLAYLHYQDGGGRRAYAAALAAFAAALLSKGSAAPLPAVLLLLAWWRGGPTRRDVMASLPFFALAGLASLIEVAGQEVVNASLAPGEGDFATRLARAGWVAAFYTGKALAPVGLSFVYPRWQVDAATAGAWLPNLAIAAALATAWWARAGWGRPVLVAMLYAGLMWSPVLGFFDIYYMRYSFVADHYQYLALPGLLALAVTGASAWLARSGVARAAPAIAAPAIAAPTIAVLAVALLGWTTLAESRHFRDSETLWRVTLERNPEALLARYNLAHLLQADGRAEEAAEHYRSVLELRPGDARAHTNLGKLAEDRDATAEALRHYRAAIASEPEAVEARNNLAGLLYRSGDSEAALVEYRAALRVAPASPEVHYNLGRLLETQGQLEQAILHHRRALQLAPEADYARAALARALAARERQESAAPGPPRP